MWEIGPIDSLKKISLGRGGITKALQVSKILQGTWCNFVFWSFLWWFLILYSNQEEKICLLILKSLSKFAPSNYLN